MAGPRGYKRRLGSPVLTDRSEPPYQTDFTLYHWYTTFYFRQTEEQPAQKIVGIMHNVEYKIMFISLCILHHFTLCEGHPLRKRTVSEVQLMHNLGDLRQVQERRDWLQMRLQGVHTAPAWDGSGEAGRTRRTLRTEDLPNLSAKTPEEIQDALNLLEKLLKSKQS